MRPVAVLLVALLVVACGGAEDAGPAPAAPTFPGSDDPELVEHAATARDELAGMLAVPADEVEVVRAEQVTWNNGALGCEQEGQAYTQALVEGYRVELRHDGETYAFHGEDGQPPFHCEEPTQAGPAG